MSDKPPPRMPGIDPEADAEDELEAQLMQVFQWVGYQLFRGAAAVIRSAWRALTKHTPGQEDS